MSMRNTLGAVLRYARFLLRMSGRVQERHRPIFICIREKAMPNRGLFVPGCDYHQRNRAFQVEARAAGHGSHDLTSGVRCHTRTCIVCMYSKEYLPLDWYRRSPYREHREYIPRSAFWVM